MRIKFTKMHGLGNDFVMIDAISQAVSMTPERARKLADRHFGVGCDQVLVVEPPSQPENDFKYRIFNADGSEVENCGNGARCFAVFVRLRRLTHDRATRPHPEPGWGLVACCGATSARRRGSPPGSSSRPARASARARSRCG